MRWIARPVIDPSPLNFYERLGSALMAQKPRRNHISVTMLW